MERLDRDLTRRQLVTYGAQGAAALFAGSALAACGGNSAGSGGTKTSSGPQVTTGPSSAGTPVKGGTLTVGTLSSGSAETVNPGVAANPPDFVRVYSLFDPLFFQVPGGTGPGLAESAEANKNATVWTLKLRSGVTWHNGKPFTADDVVYTIKTWGTKASQYQGQASALIDLPNVRKLDSLTVQVPLRRPAAWFPAFATSYTSVVIPDGTTSFSHPIGTGPFKFGSFTPGSSSSFPANPDYWRGPVHIDTLVVNSSFTDDAARVNALVSGQLDIAPELTPSLAKANAASGSIVLGNSPGPAMLPLVMRVNVPPFNDARVVQAFKLAIQRESVVSDVFDGYATLGNDSPGATLQYWASDLKPTYDPEKAKSLLKAAGQENLTMPFYTAEVVVGMNETATNLSAQLKGIGVNAPVKVLPASTYYTTASPAYLSNARKLWMSDWNVFPPSLGAFYDQAMTLGGIYAETGWGHSPGQETLINEAFAETNPTLAAAKWHAVQEQQIMAGGYLVPANFNYLDGYAPKVRGVITNQAGNNANYVYYNAWLAS